MKRTNHYITEQQISLLKGLSDCMGMTSSELIRRAIDEYLAREYRKRRKADGKG